MRRTADNYYIPMEISKDEIRRLAGLCRLGLTENEEERFQKELSSVLNYVNQLNEADTGGVDPDFGSSGTGGNLRPDEISRQEKDSVGRILADVPRREGDYVKVKSVLEREEESGK